MLEFSIQDWGTEPPAENEADAPIAEGAPPPSWRPSAATIQEIMTGDDFEETAESED